MELKVHFQTKDLARKIGRRLAYVAPATLQVLAYAELSEQIFAPYADRISAQEARKWLTAFARGMQYTYETYGHSPTEFYMCDVVRYGEHENDTLLYYEGNGDRVILTRNFLVKQIETTRGLGSVLGNNNTPPNMGFTVNEMGTLLGVEESYHSYQMMVLADRYTQADKSAASQFMDAAADTEEARTAYYNENAVERGARQVVADAARHYGLGKRLASLEATLEN